MHSFDLFNDLSRERELLPRIAQLDSPDPLFDAFDHEPPRRPGALPRVRHSPAARPRKPGVPEGHAARTALRRAFPPLGFAIALAAMLASGCSREEPAPVVRDAILVQLHDASRLPDWSRPDENGPAIIPLMPIAGDGSDADSDGPLFRVPVPADAEPAAFAAELARDPAVDFAEPIALQQPLARTPNDPRFRDQWGLAEINAPAAWETTTGDRAVAVAVIDDGVALTHNDLAANLWTNPGELAGNGLDDDSDGIVDDVHGASFIGGVASGDPSPDLSASSPWHGTQASGIIGAVGDNGAGVTGVNWRVSLMALRALGSSGGRSDDLVQAIDYASQHGARVINASWGGKASAAVEQAIVRATRRGAVFVVAAGNDGAAKPGFPANLELANLLSVGALDVNGALAPFSNRGALLAAPGVGILSTSAPGSYERADGTSVAAPHVAGLAALLFAAHPDATAEQVSEAILSSAIATAGVERGRIDAVRALAALSGKTGGGPSGLLLSRDALTFNAASGETPHAQVISIRAANGTATDFTATSSAGWLKTVHTRFTTPARATIYVDPTGLPAGEQTAEIVFTDTGGAVATLHATLTIGPRSSATALGAGCGVAPDGIIQVQRGSLCTIIAPGVAENANAPGVSWLLPEGASASGGRLTAIFPRRGSFTLQVGEGTSLASLVVAVE